MIASGVGAESRKSRISLSGAYGEAIATSHSPHKFISHHYYNRFQVRLFLNLHPNRASQELLHEAAFLGMKFSNVL